MCERPGNEGINTWNRWVWLHSHWQIDL